MRSHHRLLSAITQSPLWLTGNPRPTLFSAPHWAGGVDTRWYARTYRNDLPHPAGSGICTAHYIQHASSGSFSPNLLFGERFYRLRYPEVADLIGHEDYVCGWHHYLFAGWKEANDPVWWFSERWYRSQNPEVAEGVRNGSLLCGFEHYLLYGIKQDLAPSVYFHPRWYRQRYLSGDAKILPIVDYLLSRDRCQRCPAPFFDPAWYQRQYLVESEGANQGLEGRKMDPLEHYASFGITRHYSPSPQFDERSYREANPHVGRLIAEGLYRSGFEHYAGQGLLEGATVFSHVETGGLDYAGPEFVRLYDQSLRLNLRQAYLLEQFRKRP